MTAGLRSLLSGSIDYAGTFPPARLPLAEAVSQYAAHRKSPHAWLLGRFVCPATQLAEALAFARECRLDDWSLSAVVPRAGTSAEFISGLREDLDAMRRFNIDAAGRAAVKSIECRLPADLAASPSARNMRVFLAAAGDRLQGSGVTPVELFVEPPLTGDWRPTIAHLAGVLAERNGREAGADTGNGSIVFGFKLRAGGVEAAAIPTARQVAAVVRACAELDLPWKATAGLHQPLGRFDVQLGCRTFGFLSLLAAAVLAEVHQLDEPEIEEALQEEDPGAIRLDERGLRWRGRQATPAAILAARQTGLASFGSCSFDEPRTELAQLGLLTD